MPADLQPLFDPRCIAVVGAGPNDPGRMGTRTLHDLVSAHWPGTVWPVSGRYTELYGLKVWPSLRDLPGRPDVVLARTPSAGVEALVDDAAAVGARFLVILAAGFAETGDDGRAAQQALLTRAKHKGVRILGPQSIGFVNLHAGLPASLSQIMERLRMDAGPVALLTQSGAMAISLAVRGQHQVGIDFSLVATFGNAADVTPADTVHWLATHAPTRVVGLYMEGIEHADAFAAAVQRCRDNGKPVVVLRSGLSRRGAAAVASHTASMSGDADAFRALCRQLGVVLTESAEDFLWTLKAASGTRLAAPPRVAFASISGGACALWADRSESLGLSLPPLDDAQQRALAANLPPFLAPGNPLDLGPAVFDDQAFERSLSGLIGDPAFDLLVTYLFTSSPSLMGGLRKVRLLEDIARRAGKPLWVIWEAATDEEWAALARSDALVAFRDLAQAAGALALLAGSTRASGYRGMPSTAAAPATSSASDTPADLSTEPAVKGWLRAHGLSIPAGVVCTNAQQAGAAGARLPGGVAVKIVSPDLQHKSEVGGVVICDGGADAATHAHEAVIANVRAARPDARIDGVLVEERIRADGLELFVSVRRVPVMGLVTVIGRGGVQIEVDRDYVVHVGALAEADVGGLVARLRCAPLLAGHRGRPALAVARLAEAVIALQRAVAGAPVDEIELNPVLLTADAAWVLDALAGS